MIFLLKLSKTSLLVASVFSLSILSSSVVSANIQDVKPTGIQIPVGVGTGSVSYTPKIEDSELRGPESFVVSKNGDAYILDTIGQEIEIFDKQGEYQSTISLPKDREFMDIEITDSNSLYVLSDLGDILHFSEGKLVQQTKHDVDKQGNLSLGLFKTDPNSVILRYADGREINLTSTVASMSKAPTFTGQKHSKGVQLSNGMQTIDVDYTYEPVGTYPLQKTNGGEQLVLENEALIGNSVYVETRVSRYVDGKRTGTALASPTNTYAVKVPRQYVYATDNGDMYQMVLLENQVSIQKVTFSKEKRTNINKQLVSQINPQSVNKTNKNVSILSVSAADAVNRAMEMAQLYWMYDPSIHKTSSTTSTTPPQHLAGITSKSLSIGIPYDWGGMNGIDTGTSGTDINFLDGLAAGKTAGDINTNAVSSSTVGVDCSGFISAAYQFGTKYGTATLSQVFKNTTWASISKGDIGNKSGNHTWMFLWFNTNSNGEKLSVTTYESTTDGSEDRAKLWERTWADAQTYTPMTKK